MHKLDRSAAVPPESLNDYDYRTKIWKDLKPDCKKALRAALVQMQGIPDITTPDVKEYGLRCAYCECAIRNDGHIEHFRRKNKDHFPELTFTWENLFLACESKEHCGHYKDRKEALVYNPDELIKPDIHDPHDYLYFHSSGWVIPQSGLSHDDKHRAEETIRVFGLNNDELPGARVSALKVYRTAILNDLNEIEGWPEGDRTEYLKAEIESTKWEPYSTTIKHFLLKNS
ncbi:TIGR02646 family protein [Morganella morganii]|uniref:retron system putative HNH endonuclease n=1 Tax=Morganella morganii TaxID=582 RepID=UPI00339BC454